MYVLVYLAKKGGKESFRYCTIYHACLIVLKNLKSEQTTLVTNLLKFIYFCLKTKKLRSLLGKGNGSDWNTSASCRL